MQRIFDPQYEAADQILRQLRRQDRARYVLEDLRDNVVVSNPGALRAVGPDRLAVECWAQRHRLNAPAIVDGAWSVRSEWATSPRLAKRLGGLDGSVTNVVAILNDPASYQQWCRTVTDKLPAPHRETLAQWMRRAVPLYREAAGHIEPYEPRAKRSRRPGRRADEKVLFRNCRWLVLYRIVGHTFLDIALDDNVSEKAVRKAVHELEQMLGLPRLATNRNKSQKTPAD